MINTCMLTIILIIMHIMILKHFVEIIENLFKIFLKIRDS